MNDRRQDETESERILRRVAQESDPSGSTFIRSRADRLKGHLSASDVDPTDAVEVAATRVGRTLGFIITVVLIGMIVWYLAGGG